MEITGLRLSTTILCLLLATATFAGDAIPATTGVPSKSKLSERLIYSVDRTPEDTFETPRAVTVIGRDDLLRKNGMTLSDILMEEAGFTAIPERNGESTPIMRGLLARHILVMVDGVKINDSLWRTNTVTREQLNLIDVSQIERIEIVRGVVSVLGTEALGGVVNIITRRGADGSAGFGGTIGTRYGSADHSVAMPIDVWGRNGAISYHVGGMLSRVGDLEAGGNVGRQPYTGYDQRGAHANVQLALSSDKSLTVAYQALEQRGVKFWQSLVPAAAVKYNDYSIEPVRMRMATAAYQDLSSRVWADALNVSAYWNVQDDGTSRITAAKPTIEEFSFNKDRMIGVNVEIGKFIGSHHLLYGIDVSAEKIASATRTTNLPTDTAVVTRGRYTNGATYQSGSIFVNDKFNVTRFVTIAAGARYGSFRTKGAEDIPIFGKIDLNSTKKDTTSAFNVTVHAAQRLNFIAGAFRGFRAPNLDDMSKYFLLGNRATVEIPNPSMSPERIKSYEAGVKYETSSFAGSAFYFDNRLSDVIVRAPSTWNGLSFIDTSGDGKQQKGEPSILQNRNLGRAIIRGIEAEFRYKPAPWLLLFGNYTKTEGSDRSTGLPFPYIQPRFGTAAVRYTSNTTHAPWAELSLRYASSSKSTDGSATVIDVNHLETSPGFSVYTLRGGASLGEHFVVTAAIENLMDTRYSYFRYQTLSSYTAIYLPGRQLVLGTTYRF